MELLEVPICAARDNIGVTPEHQPASEESTRNKGVQAGQAQFQGDGPEHVLSVEDAITAGVGPYWVYDSSVWTA